jgi:hypothetical protein
MSKFTKQLPNSRAVCVLSSWLTACQVPHTVANDNIVTINNNVKVNVHADGTKKQDAVNVAANDLLDKDIPKAIQTFQNITEAAGFGRPTPVDRGPMPTKKLGYRKAEEFEYVAFRHREFRAAPNPDEFEFKKYEPIIKNLARSFHRKNYRLCELMGYTGEDIAQYCRVWTTNFLHKYAVHNPTEDDNEKLLVCHLMQRLPELAVLLKRRAANVKGSPDYAELVCEASGSEDPDPEWLERNREIYNKSYACRRKEAKSILETSLSKLPHDAMVALLKEAVDNTHIEADARKEAGKRLKAHVATCSLCDNGRAKENEKPV